MDNVQFDIQHNMCLHTTNVTLTVTLTQTTVLHLATQCDNIHQHSSISQIFNKSGAKKYINIESPILITPQANILHVMQKLPNKPQAKTNKKAPVY